MENTALTSPTTDVLDVSPDAADWEPWVRNYGKLPDGLPPLALASVVQGAKYDLFAISEKTCFRATGVVPKGAAIKWTAISELSTGGKLRALAAVAGVPGALDVFVLSESSLIHGEVDENRYSKLPMPPFGATQLAACVSASDVIDLYAADGAGRLAVSTITLDSVTKWAEIKVPNAARLPISAASIAEGRRTMANVADGFLRLLGSTDSKTFAELGSIRLPQGFAPISVILTAPRAGFLHIVAAEKSARTAVVGWNGVRFGAWSTGGTGSSTLTTAATVASVNDRSLEFVAANHVGNVCPRYFQQ